MSSSSQVRPIAGSLVYDFEDLHILRESGPQRRCGRAVYAYDGRGAYWPVGLTLEAQVFGQPAKPIDHGTGLWREVFRRLEHYRDEDIQARIAEDLTRKGGHMALFDEHPPSAAALMAPPPRVAAETRRTSLLLSAAGACFEGAALCALLAAILFGCLAADALRAPGRHAAVMATLEEGSGR